MASGGERNDFATSLSYGVVVAHLVAGGVGGIILQPYGGVGSEVVRQTSFEPRIAYVLMGGVVVDDF